GATWQSWLAVGILSTVALRLRAFLSTRPSLIPAVIRRLPLSSSSEPRRPQAAPIPARQPAMAVSSSSSLRRSSTPAPRRLYDTASDSNDMVRQMRSAAGRGPMRQAGTNPVLWTLALILVYPLQLLHHWTKTY